MIKIKLLDGPFDGTDFTITDEDFNPPWQLLYEAVANDEDTNPRSYVYQLFSEQTYNNKKEIHYVYDGDQIG